MRMIKHLPAIHVEHAKGTAELSTESMPLPHRLAIAMIQHIGAPCSPLVKAGDYVTVGQKIGDNEAFVSAPIHSPVSGNVLSVKEEMTSMGICPVIEIEPDGKQIVSETVVPPLVTDKESFLAAVRSSGLVGLGGAAFPSHVKFNPKNPSGVDTFLVNGAECEPYITSDYRAMMEDSEALIEGIQAVMKYLAIHRSIIGIEDNKPEAIRKLKAMVRDLPGIEVLPLKASYPKGAEKVLIYEATGRRVPLGKLPADVGALVSNVASIIFGAKYLKTGMPLVSKRVTVDGNAVNNPKNVEVLIGTPVRDVVAYCGGYKVEPGKILMGGPMMGRTIYDDAFSVIKNNNAILVFDQEWSKQPKESACINCGRCVAVCPVRLMPTRLAKAFKNRDGETLKKLRIMNCMECGSCTYVCPAKIQLSFLNRMAKSLAQGGGK